MSPKMGLKGKCYHLTPLARLTGNYKHIHCKVFTVSEVQCLVMKNFSNYYALCFRER